jgi:hypothetical protein
VVAPSYFWKNPMAKIHDFLKTWWAEEAKVSALSFLMDFGSFTE